MKIFFIFYSPRSGSTFLSRTLSNTANVVIPPEVNFIKNIIDQFCNQPSLASKQESIINCILNDKKYSDWNIDINHYRTLLNRNENLKDFLISLFNLYMINIRVSNMMAAGFGIKKGSYISSYSHIKTVFPKSKFICLIRDGRAVFNSQKEALHSITGKPMATGAKQAALNWKNRVRLIRQIHREHPKDTKVLKYEDFVLNVDERIDELVNFLNLDFHSSAEDINQYEIPNKYKSIHSNVFKEPQVSSIQRWHDSLSAEELADFESVASDVLEEEGYISL